MSILDNFPKQRPSLTPEVKKIYDEYYKSNRLGKTQASSLSQKLESWMHYQVSKDLKNSDTNISLQTLEIGSGTLNHLPYESTMKSYDIVEPFKSLYENSPLLTRIRNVYSSVFDIPFSNKYDRIISVATFEHICDLPDVVAYLSLLLSGTRHSQLRVAIPSEGTVLWKLGWKCTTGLEFKVKYGLDYGILMRHEHVNSAKEIFQVLDYFFQDVKYSSLGVSRSLSIYQFYECSSPRLDLCKSLLANHPSVQIQ